MTPRASHRNINYSKLVLNERLVAVWRRAVESNPLVIPVEGKREMTRFRFELYQTRKILEAREDPLYPQIQSFSITARRQPHTENYRLSIAPAADFAAEILNKAGLVDLQGEQDELDAFAQQFEIKED